mgnify:CR=1 FL=1
MLSKQDIYRLLDEENIWHEITEHPAAYSMADLAAMPLPYPSADAKTSSSGTTTNATIILSPSAATGGSTCGNSAANTERSGSPSHRKAICWIFSGCIPAPSHRWGF